jgi:hypothetical protein
VIRRPRAADLAAAAGALGAAVALLAVPHDWHASQPLAASRAERLAAPVRSIGLDPRLFPAARRIIPPDGVYTILADRTLPWRIRDGLEAQAPLWLLPRRHTPSLTGAGWVISLGGDLGPSSRYVRIVHVGPRLDIGELQQ